MKKTAALSLILFLLSLAASAQVRNADLFRRNLLLQRYRSSQVISASQLRLRTENIRLQIAREKILRDGAVNPYEKRKLKKIKKQSRHKHFRKKHRSTS